MNGMGVFAAIVEAGSFAAAGDMLDMSQPGVSRVIARLEARLGVRLFDRTSRAVSLTEDGQRFHQLVMPLLAGLQEAADSTTRGATVLRGRLRVNLDPLMSRLLEQAPIGAFLRNHPELQLELATRTRLGDMVGEGFDLALRFGEHPGSHVHGEKLLESRLVTVAAPAYLARCGRPVTPEQLCEHTCIQFREPEHGRLQDWVFQRGRQRLEVPVTGALTVSDVGSLQRYCLEGEGVAQMLVVGCEAALKDGSLVELFSEWPDERVALYALTPARQRLAAKTRAFLDFVDTRIHGTALIAPLVPA